MPDQYVKYQQQSQKEYRTALRELQENPTPEVKQIAREQYQQVVNKINKLNQQLAQELLDYWPTRHSPTLRALMAPHLKETYPLDSLQQKARRLQRFFAHTTAIDKNSKYLSQAELEALKDNNAIEDLYDFDARFHASSRLFACCPFHEEKLPSFVIYTDQNSFYCYGCNKGGDVIDFVKILYKCNFKDAIAHLVSTGER